jgi:hypothetical protein
MQISCPICHARYALEAALTDAAAREAVAVALKLPAPLGGLLLQYIGLFRPAKRSLSWSRVTKLLTELQTLIKAGEIERNGRAWVAPQSHWQAALEQMLNRRDKLSLPLANHGYLLEILAGMANKSEARAEAEAMEAKRRPSYQRPAGECRGKTRSAADILEEKMRGQWDKELGVDKYRD